MRAEAALVSGRSAANRRDLTSVALSETWTAGISAIFGSAGAGDDFDEGDGSVAGSPSGAPPTTQAATIRISSWLSAESGDKSPNPFTAPQGGMARDSTCSLIATAHGRTFS